MALGQKDLAREEFTRALEFAQKRHFPQREEANQALEQAKAVTTQ